jgi:DNA-binding CsgD family transcriptional regulator
MAVLIAPSAAPEGAARRDGEDGSPHLSRWFARYPVACVFLSGESLEILDANDAATALLAGPGELSRTGGKLVLGGKAATETFRRFVRELGASPAIHTVGEDEARLLLRVERIGDGLIALQIFRTDEGDGLWADTGAIFGLTRAEDRLVKRLIGGANIEELSEALGISVETARTHVRRSYVKIGVNNREQLFATLAPFRLRA